MEVRRLTKEELGAKVLFPRTQLKGIDCKDADQMPARQDFDVEVKHDVPGMGDVKLIVGTREPRMVFQIIETKSEQEFDSHLGTLLGMHKSPSTWRAGWTSLSCSRAARTSWEPRSRTTRRRSD